MSGLHVERADLTIDLRSNPDRSDEILRSESSNKRVTIVAIDRSFKILIRKISIA